VKITGILLAVMVISGSAFAAGNAPVYTKALLSGQQVFQSACVHCHGDGLAGAPRAGDKTVWKELIAEGFTDIAGSAMAGVRRMPPMGGEPALYDMEVARAVNYMVEMAGGKFPEPTDASVKAARLDGEKRLKARIIKARQERK
jgi:cytochrome c5